MALTEFLESVSCELALVGPRYAARRFDHPALASYPTISSLLAETAPIRVDKKWRVTPEGARILCALIELHQRTSRDRLWVAILFRAFEAMLKATARRLKGGSRDDQTSLLLASFSRALVRVDPKRDPERIAMYVRYRTRRALFRALKKELEWDDTGFGIDAELCADPVWLSHPLLDGTWAGPRSLDDAPNETLASTKEHRGALWALVRQRYGSLPEKELVRAYRRLQRRRHRKGLKRPVPDVPSASGSLPPTEERESSPDESDVPRPARDSGVDFLGDPALLELDMALATATEVES